MKKLKKLRKLAALLCTSLLFTALWGCSGAGNEVQQGGTQGKADALDGADNTESAKGRFLETEIELPEKISTVLGVRKCTDDSIVLIGYDENYIGLYRACTDNQGADWEEEALNSGDYTSYRAAAIDEEGSVALFGYFSSKEDSDILLVAKDGSSEKLTLQMPEYKGGGADTANMLLSADYAAGKLFVVDLNNVLYEVDTESGELRAVSHSVAENISGILPLGNRLAVLTGNGVRFLEIEEGARLSEDAELEKALGIVENHSDTPIYPVGLTIGANADDMYYVNHEGIFFHKFGGSTIEQLANGELMSVGDRSISFRKLVQFDDEHFMVFAVDSLGNEVCYSYAYDANVSAVPEKQLKIYALEDSIILQQAVSAYQKSHPDVFVKKMIGMSGDNSVTAEDAIKTLNTEIMAGSGPDVLVLDGLPVDSYVEKNILSDISEIVSAVDQTDGLFTNITDAYKADGKIYQVPLRFFFAAAEWNDGLKEINGSPDEIAAYIKTLKNDSVPVLAQLPAEMLLYTFYDAYSASWKTGTGIDQEALKRSLDAAKVLYDIDGYAETERFSYGSVFADSIYQGQIIYGTMSVGGHARLTDTAQVSIGTLCGVDAVMNLYGMESSKSGSFGLLSAGEQRAFVPFVCLGLAENAKDNEMAKEFIQASLSADGQRQMNTHFSVNKKAYENECANSKPYSIGGSDEEGRYFGFEVKVLSETQVQALTAMLESLNTPMWSDRVVQELVIGEGKKYLQNEQSLEDAVTAIAQKVQLYVSE